MTAIGYCVGGTLLAATLGYMAATGDDRIESATFFTTQIDFTDAGDLKVFVDAEQLKQTEKRMEEQGYLEGWAMAQAFNMLRPNDLIWSYYVNNYLKGKEPMPFDLLVWNADATRMPAANHKFYLRHCYFQNDLSNGRMKLGGQTIDLKKVTIPVYELAAKEDHIAPARSAFNGAKCLGGPVRYVMAGSGHIAGVINPPTKPKYQYWTGGPVEGDVRGLGQGGQRDAGLVVAGLDPVAHRAVAREGSGPHARRGQAEAALRRAGRIRADQVVATGAARHFQFRSERFQELAATFAGGDGATRLPWNAVIASRHFGCVSPPPCPLQSWQRLHVFNGLSAQIVTGANSRAGRSTGSGGDQACDRRDVRSWDVETGAEIMEERDFEFGAGLGEAEHDVAGGASLFADRSA